MNGTSILERIARGDPAAVAECMEVYGPLVWSVARRRLADVRDAEEVVQDVFCEVWAHAGRYDPLRGSEKTFVLTIARRRIIDRGRRRPPPVADVDPEDLVCAVPQDSVEKADDVRQVDQALESLRPTEQTVIRLSFQEGLSHGEISEALGIPLGTVKTHARRGLQRARDLLRGHRPEGGS